MSWIGGGQSDRDAFDGVFELTESSAIIYPSKPQYRDEPHEFLALNTVDFNGGEIPVVHEGFTIFS